MIVVNPNNMRSGLRDTVVIGIYYPNGVFCETRENHGVSYVLDHLLYEMLLKTIEDHGGGYVLGHTYYGYSGFQVVCSTSKVNDVLERIRNTFYVDSWSDDHLSQWFAQQKKVTRGTIIPVEHQYYAKAVPGSPLAKTLSSGLNRLPSCKQLREWRTKYIRQDQIVCYITGGAYGDTAREDSAYFPESMLPSFSPSNFIYPKCAPWRHTNIIYAVPYFLTEVNTLASEAYCELLRPRIAWAVNGRGGQLCSTAFHPDFVPELRIHFHVNRGNERSTIKQLDQIIMDCQNYSAEQIAAIRKRIHSFYCRMREDPVAWNRFAGYNMMSGNRYDLVDLLNLRAYEKQITQDSLLQVAINVQNNTKRNIFITAVR